MTNQCAFSAGGALHLLPMEDRAMSQSENFFEPARLVLDLPICPKCGARMWLARIEPDEPGHDKRTFECPQCDNVVSQIVKYR
jgi:hypothetical protein